MIFFLLVVRLFITLIEFSRAMQLLSSGLNLATQQFQEGHLKASTTVKNGKNTKKKTRWGYEKI